MNHKPWLPYLVTDYINMFLIKRYFDSNFNPLSIFEWGSGNSTVFFVDLPHIGQLISIEHNAEWYYKTEKLLIDRHIKNYHYVPFEDGSLGGNPANPRHYKSNSTELGKVNFRRYASAIDDYGLFDLILIDGMARASCLHHAFNHVAPGGCIVLDNTGDRPYYLEQTEAMFGNYETGWEKITMMGYGPILDYKWETTIFINRSKADYE